jgi:hypothetical protein
MRQSYVRFVTAIVDEYSGRRQGLFQAAGDLEDGKELRADEVAELRSVREWFNENLDKPLRFSRSRKSGAASKAISWFKSSAVEHVRRMHAICRILEEHGIQTEMITTARPGYIVFEDEFQVAAEPFAETRT